MRAYIKFGGNLMHVSGFLSGGFLMGVEAFHFEWELHPHECGRGGGSPMAGRHAPWVPPNLPFKSPPSPPLKAHLPAKDLSPPFRISPWSRISEIHVPGGFFWKDLFIRFFAGARARMLLGYPDVCAITDAPMPCGAGLDGAGPAGPDGLHHDL